jgi:hypothetical protein
VTQHDTLPLSNDEDDFTFDYTQFSQEIEATQASELLAKLREFAKNAIHLPLQTFATTHSMQITTRRIQQATTPLIYRTTAQRIADAIQQEPPVTHQTLTGLITECTTKQTSDLRLKVKSLQDQLAVRRTPTNDTHWRNSKNFRGSSIIIWKRKHPSRNTPNQTTAADTQQFPHHQPTNSTKQPHQHLQTPTNITNSTFNHRFTPRPNATLPTSAKSTLAAQPQRKDLNASNEPARKRGRRSSKSNMDMS